MYPNSVITPTNTVTNTAIPYGACLFVGLYARGLGFDAHWLPLLWPGFPSLLLWDDGLGDAECAEGEMDALAVDEAGEAVLDGTLFDGVGLTCCEPDIDGDCDVDGGADAAGENEVVDVSDAENDVEPVSDTVGECDGVEDFDTADVGEAVNDGDRLGELDWLQVPGGLKGGYQSIRF